MNGGYFKYTASEERAMEAAWDLDARAWKVLDLIAAEFASDPMSTQCFDTRIVSEARLVCALAKENDKLLPALGGKKRLT